MAKRTNDPESAFRQMLQAGLGIQPKPEEESEIAETWLELQKSIVDLAKAIDSLPDGPVSEEVHSSMEAVIDMVEAHELELEAAGVIEPGDELLEEGSSGAGVPAEENPEA